MNENSRGYKILEMAASRKVAKEKKRKYLTNRVLSHDSPNDQYLCRTSSDPYQVEATPRRQAAPTRTTSLSTRPVCQSKQPPVGIHMTSSRPYWYKSIRITR